MNGVAYCKNYKCGRVLIYMTSKNRWLQFSEESTLLLSREYIPVDVMTFGKVDKVLY
jgi:hypothetical protein